MNRPKRVCPMCANGLFHYESDYRSFSPFHRVVIQASREALPGGMAAEDVATFEAHAAALKAALAKLREAEKPMRAPTGSISVNVV